MRRREFFKAAVGLVALAAFSGKLKAEEGSTYILNETASRILDLRRKGLSDESIARALTEEYEVEYDRAYEDVISFLKESRRLKIV